MLQFASLADIFISHSKRDAETIAAFCNVFARTNIRAILAEFENYAVPPWLQIRNYVQQSSAVFLLLSPHLSGTAYTQNWVSYEVGLACALNKPVWVYEHWQDPVHFPVPYLTDYVLYEPQSREHLNAIKHLVERYDPSPSLAGMALGGLIGAALSGGPGAGLGAMIGAAAFQRRAEGCPLRCPHLNCGVQFRLHTWTERLQCPSCRQDVHVNWPAQTQTSHAN